MKKTENNIKNNRKKTTAKAQSTAKTKTRTKTVKTAAKKKNGSQRKQPASKTALRVIPLGGIGEIGKNLTVLEYGEDIIIIDCGLKFPTEEMLGVDYVIPDISYLEKNAHKVKGIFVTHGHEDHIGGIPYIADKFNAPIYALALTNALIESKLSEKCGEDNCIQLITVKADDKVKCGVFTVEFIRVSHSIDDAVGFAIKTPVGTVVHTGDFKMDLTPVGGKIINLSRFAELGKSGVLLLMSDSTNAERPGFNRSESNIGESFIQYFKQAKGRIIVATFASNVHRLQQVVDAAKIYNKKICLSGRSMVKIVNVTRELGMLDVDDAMLIQPWEINNYKDSQVVILSTGSQGENMSGLVRMATGQHPKISVKPGDTVILSSTPIPGNERYVYNVINQIYKIGATVIDDADTVHVSGHARQEELKLILSLVKPKYFIPVHGEYRHLYKHAALGEKMGIKKKNIFILENGSVVEFTKRSAALAEPVAAGGVFVDGLGIGDVGEVVMRDRKQLANDGLFVVVMTLSKEDGRLLTTPDVVSRGFIYVRESEGLINDAKKIVSQTVEKCYNNHASDWGNIKNLVKKDLSKYLYNKTQRNPMIIPIIIEV